MKKIVCFGDSNTWGYDSRSFIGEQFPKDVRWEGLLNLETDWTLENYGVNGREIPRTTYAIENALDLFARKAQEAKKQASAGDDDTFWVWIMLGTNDLSNEPNFVAEDVAKRMRIFLSAIVEMDCFKSGQMKVRLIGDPVAKPGFWVESQKFIDELVRLGPIYGELAEEFGIAFTDVSVVDIDMLADGVHFSPEGHRVFADVMKKVLIDE